MEVTNHDRHSYRLSPFTPNQRTRRCNTINGGATISDRHRHRREISEGEERGVLKIYLSIPNFRSEQKKSCVDRTIGTIEYGQTYVAISN